MNETRDKIRAKLILAIYLSVMTALGIIAYLYIDSEALQEIVSRTGLWGVVVFLLIEYIYIVLVPIYNTAVHLAAGFIFGGFQGWVLNFIATTLGLFTIIFLVQRYGRRVLIRVVPENILKRYDKFAKKAGPLVLFVVYVLPFFPDDEITYLIAAGGGIRFRRFVLPILLGNISKTTISYVGAEGAAGIATTIELRALVAFFGFVLIMIQEYLLRERD